MKRLVLIFVFLVLSPSHSVRAVEMASSDTLDDLTARAAIVLKVTALKTEPVQDAWLPPARMLGAGATRFTVISIIKGEFTGPEASFHHYVDLNSSPLRYFRPAPLPHYKFKPGQHYLLWADKSEEGNLRQLSKSSTTKISRCVIRVGDNSPVQGEIKSIVWDELVKMTGNPNNVRDGLGYLRWLSGATGSFRAREPVNGNPDFPLERFIAVLIPLFHSPNERIAFSAILAASGVGAPIAKEELLKIAGTHPKRELRAMALNSLRGLKTPDVQEAAHRALQTVPPELTTDDAALLQDHALRLLADFPGERSRFAWRAYAAHPQTRVRAAVATAIGEAREGALAWMLGNMVDDPHQEVRYTAVRSLLALPSALATATWKKRCTPDYYGQFFINALAARNIEPYLPKLTNILLHPIRPKTGVQVLKEEPDYTSWRLLFDYVKTKPKATLESATFAPLLDALENSRWISSNAAKLYRFFLTKKLKKRARALQARSDFVPSICKDFSRIDREMACKETKPQNPLSALRKSRHVGFEDLI